MVRVHWRVSVVGNKAPGFQPYDTFQCQDGWGFVGVLGPVMFPRVTKLLGLEPEEFSFDACSRDAAAVNSAKGLEFDRMLRKYCAARTAPEVDTVLNNAQIGCSARRRRLATRLRTAACSRRELPSDGTWTCDPAKVAGEIVYVACNVRVGTSIATGRGDENWGNPRGAWPGPGRIVDLPDHDHWRS